MGREPEKRRGRRRGRNRRRNRRRQEARQQAAMSQGNNMNASGRMMDNRSFYGHDYAMNGAQRHPGHGPGGGMHHHPPGRGMDGPRWERNGGPHFNQNDRDDPRDPYNRGRHNRDFERRSPGRAEEEHQKRGGGSGTKLRSRDRDRDRNRDRDRDRDHRDRVRDHDRSRDRDRQREHDRSRERDRDRGGRGRSRSRSSTRSRSRSQSRSRSYDSTDEYSSSSSKSRSRSRSRSHTSQNDNDGSLGKNNQESSVGSRQKSKNENSGRKRTRSESPNSSRSRSGSRKKEHPNSSTNGRTESQQQTIKSESNDNSKRNEKGSGSENENKSKIVDICSNTRDSQPEGDKTCEGEGNKVIVRSISLDKEEGIDDEKGKMKDKNEDEKNSKKEDKKEDKKKDKEEDDTLTKDQRTVFVSQLVMRTEEKDIRRYFRRKCGCRVNDVILLRDKRTGRHKGCAYVELGKLEDVPRVLGTSGKTPDFQRFPILIKASEAEKNYSEKMNGSDGSGITNIPGSSATVPGLGSTLVRNLYSAGDKRIEAQKVYLGSIDRNVTQAQLYAIFSQFGQLEKVMLQVDTTTGLSKGFAFLSFKDAKVANLAIQVMSGQLLAGRSLRTGWANMNTTVPGLEEVTSSEFPENSVHLIQNVHMALTQLNGTGLVALPGLSLVPGMSGLTSGNA